MNSKVLSILFLGLSLSLGSCNGDSNGGTTSDIRINKEVAITTKNQMQLPNFTSLVKIVGNTVVNINAETTQKIDMSQFGGLDPNDPFYDLFKKFMPQVPEALPRSEVRRSVGSGFIISTDGYILTNAHVVVGAKKIVVRTTDKQELAGKLIGLDLKTDIALIKVEGKNLNAVKVGDPNMLEVGEWVAAIGAPFGFDNSVTQGIVSAKGRNLPTDSYVPFIQTDVPINPGNSGGPLFNLNGEVVAMNSQIYSRSGGYMGLSFSIPIDIAMNIANQLKHYGKVTHGQLGVQVQAVTKQLAESFGLKKASGALVSMVIPGSSADNAGVKTGDVILKVNGKEIDDYNSLPMLIGSKKPGDRVNLGIYRNGKEISITAVLAGLSKDATGINGDNGEENNSFNSVSLQQFGLTVSDIDPITKQKLNLTQNGVIVTNVQGVTQMSGILPGDVILSVNNKTIKNVDELKSLVGKSNSIALLVLRNKQQMFVTLSIE